MTGLFDIEHFASVLSRCDPTDAGTAEVMDKHWAAANHFAAEEVLAAIPEIMEKHTSKDAAVSVMLRTAKRIRREYLARVTA